MVGVVEIRKQTPKRSRQPEDASLLRFISECSGISFHVLVGLASQSLSVSSYPSDSLTLFLSLFLLWQVYENVIGSAWQSANM